nr:MAG TPA: hypothetical protein [Caudoviricetes sp.]
MRANIHAEYFAFFTIFAQNPVACAELPHSRLTLDSSASQSIHPHFPSMQKRSPPHRTIAWRHCYRRVRRLARMHKKLPCLNW